MDECVLNIAEITHEWKEINIVADYHLPYFIFAYLGLNTETQI